MAIYLTSDWHFGHQREFIWGARNYSSVEEMNEDQIDKVNSLVKPEDDLYVLGDLMLRDTEKGIECVKRLNGNLHIILGNHDTNARIERYKELDAEILGWASVLQYRKYHFYMSHFPTLTGNLDEDKPLKTRVISLCGHVHTTNCLIDWGKNPIYHVEVDAHNGYPVLLDDIIEEIKNKIKY